MSAFIQHWPVGGQKKQKTPTQVHTNSAFDCNKNDDEENDGGSKKNKHTIWLKKTQKSQTIQCLLEMNWTAGGEHDTPGGRLRYSNYTLHRECQILEM